MTMLFLTLRRAFLLLLLTGLLTLVSCTLTANEVEPALPAGPVNQANTVAYHLNGQSVVAHNYADLATVILLPFLGPFGPGQPVWTQLRADGTLTVSCVDDQNVVRPGFVQHGLTWQLRGFQGVGAYSPVAAATALRLSVRDQADETWQTGPTQPLTTQVPVQVIITEWIPASRHVRGTFTLEFEAAGNAPYARLSEGQFDLTLAPE